MSIYIKRIILLIATMGLLATAPGCSVSEKKCLQNDWQTLGYQHGEDGKSADALNRFVEGCAKHGVTPDASAYSAGYEVGIALYCTAENGAEQGSKNKSYSGACPPDLEKPFLENYIDGLRLAIAELEIDYDRDSLRLDELRANRDRLSLSGKPYAKDDKRIKSAVSSMQQNATKRKNITSKIRKWSGRI